MIDIVYRYGLPLWLLTVIFLLQKSKFATMNDPLHHPIMDLFTQIIFVITSGVLLFYFFMFPFYKACISWFDPHHAPFLDRVNFPECAKAVEAAMPQILREFKHNILSQTLAERKVNSDDINTEIAQLTKPVGKISNAILGGLSKSAEHKWHFTMFYFYGKRYEVALSLIPSLNKLLNEYPQLVFMVFSILEPRSRIPMHHGALRGIWRLHVPLILPKDAQSCYIEVDGIRHQWKQGEAVMFDDTFSHQVVNDTDEPRALIMADVERFSIRNRFVHWFNHWLIHSSRFPLWLFHVNAKNEKSIATLDQSLYKKSSDSVLAQLYSMC
jgi:aspartyl/asparaginyl beta-hydroxylase (cupin superfamily)